MKVATTNRAAPGLGVEFRPRRIFSSSALKYSKGREAVGRSATRLLMVFLKMFKPLCSASFCLATTRKRTEQAVKPRHRTKISAVPILLRRIQRLVRNHAPADRARIGSCRNQRSRSSASPAAVA